MSDLVSDDNVVFTEEKKIKETPDTSDADLRKGLGLLDAQRYRAAAIYFRKAAKSGNNDAAYYIGTLIINQDVSPEKNESGIRYLTTAADSGHARAMYSLGLCYKKGWAVPANSEEAFSWKIKAAESGHKKAIDELFKLLTKGSERDHQHTIEHISRIFKDTERFSDFFANVKDSRGVSLIGHVTRSHTKQGSPVIKALNKACGTPEAQETDMSPLNMSPLELEVAPPEEVEPIILDNSSSDRLKGTGKTGYMPVPDF